MKKKKKNMKKLLGKKFQQYSNHEPLLKSGAATDTEVAPNNKDMYNKADNALISLTKHVGIPRQKVRMK
jgi:hypothetical protein